MNIVGALAAGYTIDQVMDLLGGKYPELINRLKSAKRSGYNLEKYIKSFQGFTQDQLSSLNERVAKSPNPLISGSASTRASSAQTFGNEKLIPALGTLGLAAGGLYAGSRLLPQAANAIKGVLGGISGSPSSSTIPNSPIGPHPMAGAPVSPPPVNSVGSPSNATPISPQTPNISAQTAPISPQPSISPAKQRANEFVEKLGAKELIEGLAVQGKDPAEIAKELKGIIAPPTRKAYEKRLARGEDVPLEQHIKEYLTTPEGFLREDVFKPEEKKPQKGDFVFDQSTGNSGELKDVRNKEALLEEGGKTHKVKIEDLERTPEELIEAAQNLLKIPEVDRSSVISLVTYRPTSKQMFIQYHNGETYVYEDIPQERVDEIAGALGIPVTTGKNIYGAWEQGKQDSRGAALIHNILRDPKYSKENEGKTWEKLGTFYDYWKGLRRRGKRKNK